MNDSILIIASDFQKGDIIRTYLKRQDLDVELVLSLEAAIGNVKLKEWTKLLIYGLHFRDYDANCIIDWFNQNTKIPIWLIEDTKNETSVALNYLKLGIQDYLSQPLLPEVLWKSLTTKSSVSKGQVVRQLVADRRKELRESTKTNQVDDPTPQHFVNKFVEGKTERSRLLSAQIRLISTTDIPVILFGPTGSGKEHLAREIHDRSSRSDKPFIVFDCGAISSELALSELFGHVKGSFTGAYDNREGAFLRASGGTLFLDEIENLPINIQVHLLRAIQEMKIRRLGKTSEESVNVRIIAATNQDLRSLVDQDKFRKDLLYRLQGYQIDVPGLDEIKEDIPLFIDYFIDKYSFEFNKPKLKVDPELVTTLVNRGYEGNIRELQHLIKLAVLNSDTCISTQSLDLNSERSRLSTFLKTERSKVKIARLMGWRLSTLQSKLEQYNL